MIPSDALPFMAETTLLPFYDRIIYDGTIGCYSNISIGPNIRKSFKTSYSEIKKDKGIIDTF